MENSKTEYQASWPTLDEAKTDAIKQSKGKPDVDFHIVQSVKGGVRGADKIYYVEEGGHMIRGWEKSHGYYVNGKKE